MIFKEKKTKLSKSIYIIYINIVTCVRDPSWDIYTSNIRSEAVLLANKKKKLNKQKLNLV